MQTDANGIPRRNRLDLNTPLELAIREAHDRIELAGAHPLLTEAVNLIDQAREKVADWIELDGVIRKTEFAWVIERGDSEPSRPTYYTGGTDGWSQNNLDAIRFSRKQDAEKAAYALNRPNCRIAEHGWG